MLTPERKPEQFHTPAHNYAYWRLSASILLSGFHQSWSVMSTDISRWYLPAIAWYSRTSLSQAIASLASVCPMSPSVNTLTIWDKCWMNWFFFFFCHKHPFWSPFILFLDTGQEMLLKERSESFSSLSSLLEARIYTLRLELYSLLRTWDGNQMTRYAEYIEYPISDLYSYHTNRRIGVQTSSVGFCPMEFE